MPTHGRFLLDTNAVIAIFANDRSAVELVQGCAECFLPAIVLGELYFGVSQSSKANDNQKRIEEFSSHMPVLVCDHETAVHYGRIKHALRKAGTPIPENDVWIAAIASQHDLTLMSNDQHFDHVQGLVRAGW
jgi:tRNA(fMet)-specific endonuclease VapC